MSSNRHFKLFIRLRETPYRFSLKKGVENVPLRKTQKLSAIVGANITARRKLKGWTQAEFAEKMGMGPDSLSRIERGSPDWKKWLDFWNAARQTSSGRQMRFCRKFQARPRRRLKLFPWSQRKKSYVLRKR